MPVPNTFATATTSIPLSQLDANFATAITIGNTAVQLGNTITTLNNMTLSNATVNLASNLTVPGNLTVSGDLIPSSSFLRNRIINGEMAISQRAAVNTNVAVGTGTSGTFGPDRFYAYTGTASLWNILQITTGASDFPYANRLQRIAGQTSTAAIYWRQIVESVNCTDLSGQSVVLSFYANAGANYSGGAVTAQVYTGTGTDQGATSLNTSAWTGFATPVNSTFTPTTTRTRYTFTGTIGSGIGELAISLTWSGSGTAGANDYVDITGVQLEVGSNATPFERRQYGQELALCQRYYWRSAGVNGGFPYIYGNGFTSTALVSASVSFPVQMRTAPTINKYGTWTVSGCGQPAALGVDQNGFTLYVSATSATNVACSPSGSTTYLDTSGAEL